MTKVSVLAGIFLLACFVVCCQSQQCTSAGPMAMNGGNKNQYIYCYQSGGSWYGYPMTCSPSSYEYSDSIKGCRAPTAPTPPPPPIAPPPPPPVGPTPPPPVGPTPPPPVGPTPPPPVGPTPSPPVGPTPSPPVGPPSPPRTDLPPCDGCTTPTPSSGGLPPKDSEKR